MTELEQKVAQWHQLKSQLEQLTAAERTLRDEITALATDGVFKPGTTNVELPQGWKLRVVQKLTQTVDQATFYSIQDKLRGMGVMVDRLVTWKPSLSTTEYKQLSSEQKAEVDTMLTTKPGAPTVELVPPK